MLRLDNLRPGGALRWKAEGCRLGRSGNVMWKADTSKVVAPSMSVKDRGVGKSSSLPSTEGGFTPTASLRNWVWTRGSVSRRAIDCVRSPLSREQWLCPSLITTT
jgi:hypothetical protein